MMRFIPRTGENGDRTGSLRASLPLKGMTMMGRPSTGGRGVRGERGSVLLLAAVLMAITVGFAGLAVDVRNGYIVRSILQHAVDDGALSALRWSMQVYDSPQADPDSVARAAAQEALRVAQQELLSQGVSGISRVQADLTAGHLTLTASASVPTYFTALFGVSRWFPRVRADAALWTPLSISASPPALRLAGPVPMEPAPLSGLSAGTGPGEGNGNGGSRPESTPTGTEPGSPGSPSSADSLGDAGPCNCDAVAAGDPRSAREALERMGVTPADPGPFQGDITSQLGLGDMQSTAGLGDMESTGDDETF